MLGEDPGAGWLAQVVAENVRAEVGRRGWTQSRLAAELGWSRSAVSKRWMGGRDWQLYDLELLARVLGVDVAALVTPRAPVMPGPRMSEPALQALAQVVELELRRAV